MLYALCRQSYDNIVELALIGSLFTYRFPIVMVNEQDPRLCRLRPD
jgi:hypothetical protein